MYVLFLSSTQHLNPLRVANIMEGKRNNIIAHMRASDVLVGIGAHRIIAPEESKLLCDGFAKTEGIIVLALMY